MKQAWVMAALAAVMVVVGCGESDDSFDVEAALASVNYVDPEPGDLCVRRAYGGVECVGSSCIDVLCRRNGRPNPSFPDVPTIDYEPCRPELGSDESIICPIDIVWWCDESIPVPAVTAEWALACASVVTGKPAWASERTISHWLDTYGDTPVPTSFDIE